MHPPSPSQAAHVGTWGLGDVGIGVVAAQVLSVLGVVVLTALGGWGPGEDLPMWATAVLQLPLWIGLTGAVVWAVRAKGLRPGPDLGLSMRWWDVPAGLAVGLLSQFALIPLVYLPLLRLLGLSADELSEPARELAGRAAGGVDWVVLAVLVVVAAPVVEEVFYRGLLLGALRKRGTSDVVAVLTSAAVFALMHFQPLQFAGLFAFGLVLGWLRVATGRLGAAIWAHVAFNAATVAVLWTER